MGDTKVAINRFLESPTSEWTRRADTPGSAAQTDSAIVHVRVDGRSQDLHLSDIGLTNGARHPEVLQALQSTLDLSQAAVASLWLDQLPNGNWILRPSAVFG